MTKTPVRNANWGFSFDEYEACFSIWKKKKPKDFAKQRTGVLLLTLGGLRSAEAKRRQSA
jgi:hypothetical protein